MSFCDICRFEEPNHAPYCPAGRKPMEPDEDHIKRRFAEIAVKCLDKEVKKLREENAKLRALVERGVHVRSMGCSAEIQFSEDCKEALR